MKGSVVCPLFHGTVLLSTCNFFKMRDMVGGGGPFCDPSRHCILSAQNMLRHDCF